MSDQPMQGPRADDAWQQVFATHYAGVVRHVAYLVGDRAAAEDVAQETFLRLMRRQPPPGELGPLLRHVASRLALNLLRSERRRSRREDLAARVAGPGAAIQGPDAVIVEQATALRAALAELAPRDRVALLLRAKGYAYAEVAAAIGVRPGSVGTVLARATRRLRRAYGQEAVSARTPTRPEAWQGG